MVFCCGLSQICYFLYFPLWSLGLRRVVSNSWSKDLDPQCNPSDPNPLQSITLFPDSFAAPIVYLRVIFNVICIVLYCIVFARNIHRRRAVLFTNFPPRCKELTPTRRRIYNSIATRATVAACNPCWYYTIMCIGIFKMNLFAK